MMVKTLYVPLDGSDVAEAAVRPGVQLALRTGANVVLLAARWPAAREQTMRSYLDAHVAFLDGPVDSWVIVDKEPADAIVEVSSEPGALVCMATHGRGALRTTVLGSVAETVVRSATGTIVLVGPHVEGTWALEEHPSILVGIDGSTHARNAAFASLQLARAIDASLELNCVFDSVPARPRAVPRNLERALTSLAMLRRELHGRGVEIATMPLDGIDPSRVLIDHVRDHGLGLLAVGSRGRDGLARLGLGSVSSSVVRHAPVPVLVTGPNWSESA